MGTAVADSMIAYMELMDNSVFFMQREDCVELMEAVAAEARLRIKKLKRKKK